MVCWKTWFIMILSAHFVFPSAPLKCIHPSGKSARLQPFLLTQPKESQKYSRSSYVCPAQNSNWKSDFDLMGFFPSQAQACFTLEACHRLVFFVCLFFLYLLYFFYFSPPRHTCEQLHTSLSNPGVPLLGIRPSKLKTHVHVKFVRRCLWQHHSRPQRTRNCRTILQQVSE